MADKPLNIPIRVKGARKAKQELGGVDKTISKIGKSALIAGSAFLSARGLVTGLQKSIELSSKFNAVSKGFDNLAKSSGFSANTLDKLTKATDGTMNSIDLMTEANNAMLLGIVNSDDQMAQMFDTAQRLAEALGQDTAFGIQSIVTGLGRQSKLMLDNLGIMVDVEKANSDYAASLNISTSALTDNQKKQAFVNAAMASANELVSKLGSETTTAQKEMAKLNATMDAVAIEIGKDLEPALIIGARAMNKFVEETKGVDWKGMMDGMLIAMAAGTGPLSTAARKLIGEMAVIEAQQSTAGKSPMENLKKTQDDVFLTQEKIKSVSAEYFAIQKQIAEQSQRAAEFTAQTATSLLTSAVMGDNVSESLKRAVIQLGIMVAQAKIYNAIMNAGMFSGGGIIGSAVKFLFGQSPTQASPSPNVTINQNFGGMGVIDSNFAANSIIPAINKAVSTGQARITK